MILGAKGRIDMKRVFVIVNMMVMSVNVFGNIISNDWELMGSRNHNEIIHTEINRTSPVNNQEVRGDRNDNRANFAGIYQMLDNLVRGQQQRLQSIPYQSEEGLRRVQGQLSQELEFLHYLLLEIRIDNNQLHRRFQQLNRRRPRDLQSNEENERARARLRTSSPQRFSGIQETRDIQSR